MLLQDSKIWIPLIADLIRAIAQILWPSIILVVLVLFRGDIRGLLGRLRRGKFLGQELELAEVTQQVDIQVKAAEEAEPARPLADPAKDSKEQLTEIQLASDRIRQFLDEAGKDKRLALLRMSIEIEQEMKAIVASYGLIQSVPPGNIDDYLRVLAERKVISPETIFGLRAFAMVRNRVMHGKISTFTDSDLLSLIDSGLRLLDILASIPRETFKVKALVTFYSDPSATIKVEDAKAVILDTTSSDGKHADRVYPTTRDYKVGQSLSWEWNMGKSWGAGWYKDPDTGEIKNGWGSAAEFVGRPLDDI